MPKPHPETIVRIRPALTPNLAITKPETGLAAECSIAIKPNAPNSVICAVRQVPGAKQFTTSVITIYRSEDSGRTWQAAPALSFQGTDLDDNEVAFGANANASVGWDGQGNAYLLTLAVTPDLLNLLGIAFYKSTDGGVTWSTPLLISKSPSDDKPNILIDTSGGKYNGRIYAIWMRVADAGNAITLARSDNQGSDWSVSDSPGSFPDWKSFSAVPWPTVSIAPDDGALYAAVSLSGGFQVFKSNNGGNFFERCSAEPVGNLAKLEHDSATVRVGMANESASRIGNGTFRADEFVSVVAGKNGLLLCAYLGPIENGPSNRIFYLRSTDYGKTWERPAATGGLGRHIPTVQSRSGFALSQGPAVEGAILFSPQLAITPRGIIVCNYYAYVPIDFDLNQAVGEILGETQHPTTGLISVHASMSFDDGGSFLDAYAISDSTWNTDANKTVMIEIAEMIDVNADLDLRLNFIGDYFGLAVSGASGASDDEGFISAWTDARAVSEGGSGSEQIYCSTVRPIPT